MDFYYIDTTSIKINIEGFSTYAATESNNSIQTKLIPLNSYYTVSTNSINLVIIRVIVTTSAKYSFISKIIDAILQPLTPIQ